MKFTLVAIETDLLGRHLHTHTSEFQKDALPEIVTNIELFLRGAGFYIKNLDYEVPDS